MFVEFLLITCSSKADQRATVPGCDSFSLITIITNRRLQLDDTCSTTTSTQSAPLRPRAGPWQLRVLFENRPALYFCIIIYLLMPIKHIFIDSVSKILFNFLRIANSQKFYVIMILIGNGKIAPLYMSIMLIP